VDDKGFVEAFRAFSRSIQKLSGITISLSDVKLIETSSPLAKRMLQRWLDGRPLAYRTAPHNGGEIEEAYVYPPFKPFQLIAKGREDVLRHLEEDSKTTTGQAGEYALARDETGTLWAIIAGHNFVGDGRVMVGGNTIAFSNGLITEVKER